MVQGRVKGRRLQGQKHTAGQGWTGADLEGYRGQGHWDIQL